MSSSTRTTLRGGKGTKSDTTSKTQKSDKTDTAKTEKNKSGKGTGDKGQSQQNSESQRNAKYKELRSEDPNIKEKIRTVTELTGRTEEEACFALHECNNDINHAVNMLIESSDQDWVTSVKKKKNRQASTNKTESTEPAVEDWGAEPAAHLGAERDKGRTRGGGPPRMRGRGTWRGRESRENEKNLEESSRGEGLARRGRMSNGPTRGGGSGRGGRGGGRLGSRTFQSRDGGGRGNTFGPRTVVDTWNASTVGVSALDGAVENWDNDFPSPIDDWYNEEYTGSLADTKVFTPSAAMEPPEQQQDRGSAGGPGPANMSQPMSGDGGGGGVMPVPDLSAPTATQQLTQAIELRGQQQGSPAPTPTIVAGAGAQLGVGSLTPSQSQFLSSLAAQNEDAKGGSGYGGGGAGTQYGGAVPSAPYGAGSAASAYGSPAGYGGMQEHGMQAQQTQMPAARTKTQRARVPPPSKIPASAVEMPGDLNSSVGYLDVEFGALDLISDSNSFDGATELKFGMAATGPQVLESTTPASAPASTLDMSAPSQPSPLDTYTSSPPKVAQTQQSSGGGGLSSALQQQTAQLSQLAAAAETMPQQQSSGTSEHLSSSGYAQPRGSVSSAVPPAVSATALEIAKATSDVGHAYSQPQPSSYPSYQSQKSGGSSVYQSTQGYSSSGYNSAAAAQVTSASSYVSSQPANSYVNSNSGSAYNNSNSNVNSYQNSSYSSSTSAYQSAAAGFPSITQAGSYQPTAGGQSGYQQSSNQSVYGATAGLSNSSNYNVTGSNQYNSYSTSSTSTHNHKMSSGKEQSYESSTAATSNTATTTTSVSASGALGLANSQTSSNAAGTKVTNSAAKSGVMTNIPPGVAPMMGTQYIMGQAGLPFYQQPMYSYEDLQLLQQRVPPHMGAYYDIGYQTPTTLATGREGSMASGAYSMSDSRFTRSDSNASPVPSTLSQQTSTQSHQAQPMLSATLPPGYAYFYNAAGMMPGSFQYGTPAIYPQMPAATNAHGSTNLSQYPKPSSYGSGYGSGYDALTQSQDYAKSGYVGGAQAQTKAAGVGVSAVTTGSSVNTDLSAMYGKSHAALGKVNSYEKQGFHSGTPPPFNLAGNQSAGIAPSGTYGPQMYIPTMPHQQHHSTTLMHQPLHQMDIRHQARRMESGNSSGQRSQSSSQAKTGAKQTYPNSYWNNA